MKMRRFPEAREEIEHAIALTQNLREQEADGETEANGESRPGQLRCGSVLCNGLLATNSGIVGHPCPVGSLLFSSLTTPAPFVLLWNGLAPFCSLTVCACTLILVGISA